MIPRTDIPFDAVPADDAGAASQTRLNSRQGAAFRRNTCSQRPYTSAPHAGGLRWWWGGIKNYNSFAQDGDGAEIAQQLARGGRICSRVVFRLRPSSPTSLPRLVNLHD